MKDDNPDQYPDRIAENYVGKTVLLTGGTGFLGKILIEKILRNFSVKKLYILIRIKKGKDPQDRLREMFANPVSTVSNTIVTYLNTSFL